MSKLGFGINDELFIRDKVPMTKNEVRLVSLSKLDLNKDSVLYDIGSGTGSITIEALSMGIKVYSIESNKEAYELTKKNIAKFGFEDGNVISGYAPDVFTSLPSPTHAFIGGTRGRLKEILKALYEINPNISIVINAISLETVGEVLSILKEIPHETEEIINLSVARAKLVGTHHIMEGENPIYIISFSLKDTK